MADKTIVKNVQQSFDCTAETPYFGARPHVQYIRDIHAAKRKSKQPVISFEFFPPKTEEGDRNLLEKTIPALLQLNPDYCSVTYGAGGSTREKTLGIVDRIQREHGLTAMAHLTCVGSTQEQLGSVLDEAAKLGIRNILALRGDPPGGSGEFRKTEGGFEFSYELVRFIRQRSGFSIGTAGFPEGHIACKEGKHIDWQRLKAKIDEGADFVLTQLFFDNHDFFEFREYMMKKLSVNIPICPGILPVLSSNQIKKFTTICGARIPQPLLSKLEEFGEKDDATTEFGIEYATKQCEELLREGVPGIHFYTLNKAYSTTRIMKGLGLVNELKR
ncbi:MAG TPA: methylenetetrahydrofolate reductase [NAD(P)H] [Verrucomicrobiae bacterium]|nr:methylenetetrahydrofolate reductase [NAD(P)H] [Verrucomicrobiae bacterium]